ncbi:MAG: divalent-cation tolerance protein CutA [Microthrixaceae bacterium]
MAKIIEVHTRTNDEQVAHRLAAIVGERRQAACAHVRGPETSRFRWKGEVITDTEWQVVAVTTRDRLEDVVATFTEIHTYELPAITWQKVRSTEPFADWVAGETTPA